MIKSITIDPIAREEAEDNDIGYRLDLFKLADKINELVDELNKINEK